MVHWPNGDCGMSHTTPLGQRSTVLVQFAVTTATVYDFTSHFVYGRIHRKFCRALGSKRCSLSRRPSK